MGLILLIGARFRCDAATLRERERAASMGIMGDERMDSVVPKVKLEGEHGTIGYRTLWGRC